MVSVGSIGLDRHVSPDVRLLVVLFAPLELRSDWVGLDVLQVESIVLSVGFHS